MGLGVSSGLRRMTEERLRALHGLVAAVQEWSHTPMSVQYLTHAERRLLRALAAVQACGADVAVVVALNPPGVGRPSGG